MKYRPSKGFLRSMLVACPLLTVLYFGLAPEIESLEEANLPGEIRFPADRPDFAQVSDAPAAGSVRRRSLDWFFDRYEDLQTWELNPWRSKHRIMGANYFKLMASDDPRDRARAKELQRLGDALWKKVLARYPELAAEEKPVPRERNGFLRWLEFAERIESGTVAKGTGHLDIPEKLVRHMAGQAEWDAQAARDWLEKKHALLNEIREIGLLTERSVSGIDVDRYGFLPARLAKQAAEMLLLDARLAAGDGDVARALESVRAARGLADHFSQVETPTLLAATVSILLDLQSQAYVVTQVLPAIPPAQRDLGEWESTLAMTVQGPAEFGRLMRGEWNVTTRQYLMPMLMDIEDPRYPKDPAALIDYHAASHVRVIDASSDASPAGWASHALPSMLSGTSHLSRQSEELVSTLFVGADVWSRGLRRAQSQTAMVQAAFSLMKGEPLPVDPIHGQPYQWDPATRTLSAPATAEFSDIRLQPIVVPR